MSTTTPQPRIAQAIWTWSGAALMVFGAACVSTALQAPPGHPSHADAPIAPQAEPASILRPDAPLYEPEGAAAEEEEPVHHHHHGVPEERPDPAQETEPQRHDHPAHHGHDAPGHGPHHHGGE